MTDRALSVKEICERYGVGEHTVLGWIRSGELRAVNVGRRPGSKKPRWRITAESLALFEITRTSSEPPQTRKGRAKATHDVVQFY
jgi:excisionase family DNA binding protein